MGELKLSEQPPGHKFLVISSEIEKESCEFKIGNKGLK
jgi:hypothetical protein